MTEIQRQDKMDTITLHKFLFTVSLLALTFNYIWFNKTVIVVNDPKFSLLGPANFSKPITFQDTYHQLIDLKNFTFKINPAVCKGNPNGFLLLIIVSSNPTNYDNRLLIRNTWGQGEDSTKLVFLLGEPENSTVMEKIRNESNIFGDIVQGNFRDAYRNMTYKHVMGLKWVSHYCQNAKYVLKTDDDIVVNSNALRSFLIKELSPWGAKGLIACNVAEHALVQRQPDSKWMVTPEEYLSPYYPDYCAGWAILYSRDVIPSLLEAAQNTPYFWIDDVHVTGELAEKVGVGRVSLINYILSERKAKLLSTFGARSKDKFLFGPPDLKVEMMRNLWNAIPER